MGNFFLPFWFGSWLSGVESLYYLTPWESWAKFPSFLPLSSLPRYFMAPHPFLNSVSSLQFILNLSVIWSFEWNKIWCFATVFVAVKTIRTSFRHFFFFYLCSGSLPTVVSCSPFRNAEESLQSLNILLQSHCLVINLIFSSITLLKFLDDTKTDVEIMPLFFCFVFSRPEGNLVILSMRKSVSKPYC